MTLAYADEDVEHALDGYGYVVPRTEGTDVLACTWTSSKWEGRASEGYVLLRVYLGRFGERDVTELSDGELLGLARDELRLLGIEAEPHRTWFHRWPRGMPQYVLGHPERLERIDAALDRHPGLALAGAAYRGVGIPDCIQSGEEAAESIARALARGPGMTRETSERLFAEASELMPGGVSSPVRAFRAVGGSPVFVERGEGAYLVDVDGNRYVDYVLSWGPLDPRPRAPARRRGARGGGAPRHELRRAEPARGRARAAHPRRDAERRAGALRQLRHRGDDERAAARARVHRAREDRQVRRLLPRSRRSSCSSRRARASRRSAFRTRPA